MAKEKVKKYIIDNTALMAEWDWEENEKMNFNPHLLTLGSHKNVSWKCSKGHTWKATIKNRNNGTGCPYCSNRKVLKGYNDLITLNPLLAKEWNYNLNGNLLPEHVTAKSEAKVWWICNQGHEWQAMVADRNNGKGCPYCSNTRVLQGYNDLITLNSLLAQEWNYDKNDTLRPEDVTEKSGKKVWWICNQGHEWQATIASRASGCGCPYCSGRMAIKGENDLLTLNPDLAKEWSYNLNGTLTPEDVTAKSGKKVWWKCSKGHEWQAVVYSRATGRGCPICMSGLQTSFQEYAILYYLEKCGIEAIHSYRKRGYEIDIYIPSKKIGIEYDGYFWHKDKIDKDLEKNLKCNNDNIKLYRIRENLPPLKDTSIDYIIHKEHELSKIIKLILSEIIENDVDIDLERDSIEIENMRIFVEKEHSFLSLNPDVALEWNFEKNGCLMPENFTLNSGKKVWWKCIKGHEWQASIANRTRGTGCPYCSNQKNLRGYNDLLTTNPSLAEEWNYEKNDGLTAMDVSLNSNKKVWWKCSKGHEWEAVIANRSAGSGCPYCSGHKVLKGYNDLGTINPTLANEWNYDKNGDVTPEDFTANSGKNAWWKCTSGHEWKARIINRNNGIGCPYCSGRIAIHGENDLQTVNPILAAEWDYESNGELTPIDVLPKSDKKVWWKCQYGHKWQSAIKNRSNGCGCPICAGQKH